MAEINTEQGKREMIAAIFMDINKGLQEAVPEMPEEWDGRHLRVLIREMVAFEMDSRPVKDVSRATKRHPAYNTVRDVARF